jgi:hypothetical protein
VIKSCCGDLEKFVDEPGAIFYVKEDGTPPNDPFVEEASEGDFISGL